MNKIEREILAPESIAIWDPRDTKWLQIFVPVESEWDGIVEALIFGLVGWAITNLLLTKGAMLPEEFQEFVQFVLALFA